MNTSNRSRSPLRRRRRTAVAVIAAAAIGAGSLSPALAGACAEPEETTALLVRALQSRLMVSALVCDTRAQYNAFVTRYRPALQHNGAVLISYFGRSYGGEATPRLNRFVTALANDASVDSNADRAAFCDGAETTLAELDRRGEMRLDTLPLRALVPLPGVTDCRTAAR